MQHRLHVEPGGRHDGIFEGLPIQCFRQLPLGALNAFANQAKAIGMHAMRAQTQHNIAWFDILARQDF